MKTIRLIAFRGTSFHDPAYTHQPALIRAGHAGWQLEGDSVIYGFHPTPEAVARIGGDTAALDWLKEHQTLDGAVYDDTAVFHQAYALCLQGARTRVFQIDYHLDDAEFDTIKARLSAWHTQAQTFPYRYPDPAGAPMPEGVDNCASFGRRLGLPQPEPTGRLKHFIRAMIVQHRATRWEPEE